jgi:hypothetical protein
VPFFINQSVYDADSEDELWFSSQTKVTIDEFEHIIEKLELASQNGTLIQPRYSHFIYKSRLINY